MSSAMMIAQVFGPFLAILGLWMLLYRDNSQKTVTAIKNSVAAQYGLSLARMLFGLMIIGGYNVWEMNLMFAVTLLGWVLFVHGVLGLFMPQFVFHRMVAKADWVKTMGIIPFIWGLILIWVGFYM